MKRDPYDAAADDLRGKVRCQDDDCCRWVGRKDRAGYGLVRTPVPGGPVLAHLAAYEASRGRLPEGVFVEHTCGNRWCVNPDHLQARPQRTHSASALPSPKPGQCQRGHPATPASVTRHSDGRIAYCRVCRNERRRWRYRTDPLYAAREIERQRNYRKPGGANGTGRA